MPEAHGGSGPRHAATEDPGSVPGSDGYRSGSHGADAMVSPWPAGATLDDDTLDLRQGAEINDSLLTLLPLVGRWLGRGDGLAPATGTEFAFAQRVTFAHDGRPFLVYESRTWLIDADDNVIRPAARETGFWRPGVEPDDIEVVLALNTGLALVLDGVAGDQRWELTSFAIDETPTARAVEGNRRLYAIVNDDLVYAHELARPDEQFTPHLTARLHRE